MGSFNLGRVKGDKGDRGETGPKGDTGAKGDKGDRGDNGRDGYTPVFKVGTVRKLENGEAPLVEIDSSDPASPVISFQIPSGKDGKDASGDMLKTIYDTEGVGADIFKYSEELFSKCLKTTGGVLEGVLTATEAPIAERAVRNITISHELPTAGAEGDVFILLTENEAKTLGECNEGDQVIIKEYGIDTVYLVAGADYHEDDTVTLIRKDLCPFKCCYDYKKRGSYPMSDIDVFLETMLVSGYTPELRRELVPIKHVNNIKRHCFLLRRNDYTKMNYFQNLENRVAKKNGLSTSEAHIIADAGTTSSVAAISTTGEFASLSTYDDSYFRPSIVLPSNLPVKNTELDSSPAVLPVSPRSGIYVFADGVWKECALR